jgi:hypothetical protein
MRLGEKDLRLGNHLSSEPGTFAGRKLRILDTVSRQSRGLGWRLMGATGRLAGAAERQGDGSDG